MMSCSDESFVMAVSSLNDDDDADFDRVHAPEMIFLYQKTRQVPKSPSKTQILLQTI